MKEESHLNPNESRFGRWATASPVLLILALSPGLGFGAPNEKLELEQAMRARANYEQGAALFRQCVSCHGSDGSGETSGSVPRIAGQHYRVLLKQLVDFRFGKRRDFRMESLADRHHLAGPQDLADVALYVAAQDRGGQRGIGSGEFAERGERLYVERCQRCHGVDAQGDDARMIPRLAGQHYGYLVRQMYDAVDGRRPSMLRTHTPRIEKLDFEQVRGLADFLSRIDPRANGSHLHRSQSRLRMRRADDLQTGSECLLTSSRRSRS
jgi:cytochrome c553